MKNHYYQVRLEGGKKESTNKPNDASWPMAGNAPLVIISGSGSWPPFLEFVDYFNKLQEQFCGYAAFACVYLSE